MSFSSMLQGLTETAGVAPDSVLGTFVGDITSDTPSEGLGDLIGPVGLLGLLAVGGAAVAATTSLGDVLSGRMDTRDPEAEAQAALLLKLAVQLEKAKGPLSFQTKRIFLDQAEDARDVTFLNRAFAAPLDPKGLRLEAGPNDTALIEAARTARRAATPEQAVYLDALLAG